jgi:hypothetical protein
MWMWMWTCTREVHVMATRLVTEVLRVGRVGVLRRGLSLSQHTFPREKRWKLRPRKASRDVCAISRPQSGNSHVMAPSMHSTRMRTRRDPHTRGRGHSQPYHITHVPKFVAISSPNPRPEQVPKSIFLQRGSARSVPSAAQCSAVQPAAVPTKPRRPHRHTDKPTYPRPTKPQRRSNRIPAHS